MIIYKGKKKRQLSKEAVVSFWKGKTI